MMVGPISPKPRTLASGGAAASAISCQKITCCIRLAPRPPYSLGHEMPAQPASYSLRCQRFRYSNLCSSDSSRRSSQSVGTLAASHARNSSRKAISSGLRFRSMINLGRQMNEDSTLVNGCSFRRSPSLHAKVADSGLNFQIKQYRTERLGLVAIPSLSHMADL